MTKGGRKHRRRGRTNVEGGAEYCRVVASNSVLLVSCIGFTSEYRFCIFLFYAFQELMDARVSRDYTVPTRFSRQRACPVPKRSKSVLFSKLQDPLSRGIKRFILIINVYYRFFFNPNKTVSKIYNTSPFSYYQQFKRARPSSSSSSSSFRQRRRQHRRP